MESATPKLWQNVASAVPSVVEAWLADALIANTPGQQTRGSVKPRGSCRLAGSWVGSSRTAHDREHPHCRAVPVSILSAGKVSPGFGTGGRFATYGLTSGDGAPGNKFLHETPKDKQSRLMNEAMRNHRGKAGGSPQAYTRTLGLS